MTRFSRQNGSFATLRQFVRNRAPVERCDLCGLELTPDHQHLIEPATRQLHCCCDACAILFSGQESARYRRVPRRIRVLSDFRMTDAQWDSLLIPIGLAFFFPSIPAGRVVAFYPSPAGAAESLLDLAGWDDLVQENPVLADLEPDVEALLVNRIGQARDYYRAPIDECYKLVGLIRTYWRGLSGGTEVWEEIDQFFASLRERS
jgi:hypothetical protein